MTAIASPPSTSPLRTALRYWPFVFALAMTAFATWDLGTGVEIAPILAASGFIYHATAAVRRRGAAWPWFIVTFVVIGAAGFTPWEQAATWALVGLAVPVAAYGLWRGAARPAEGLPLQSLAMAAYGGTAAAAVLVGGDLGGYLVAAGLLGHAAWDLWHHRTERVVSRSMTEFCLVFDVLVAVVIVVALLAG
jgi:hypothetical protein